MNIVYDFLGSLKYREFGDIPEDVVFIDCDGKLGIKMSKQSSRYFVVWFPENAIPFLVADTDDSDCLIEYPVVLRPDIDIEFTSRS